MSASARPRRWLAAAALLAALLLLVQQAGLGRWLTLEQLAASREALQALHQARPLASAAGFFGLYVLATALSVPGALVLTLAAGAVFGFWLGLLLVSFASSLGALLAFWVARHLLRGVVQARFGAALAPLDEGMRRDGTLYLLTLRLVPLFPFWLVNLLMGLTPIGAARFYLVSQIGMLAGTAVYVNAGTQLATLRSAGDVMSPPLLASLLLLGSFPLLAKAGLAAWRRRRLYAPWPRPRRFERNLVVIGAGAGGLVTAYVAAAVKARVTLVERHQMGGDCLNTGCVPSKALIRAAAAARQLREAAALAGQAPPAIDFAAVMQQVQAAVARIAPHDSPARYQALGVEVLAGQARLLSPWQVAVTQPDGTTHTLTTRSIVIATGAQPALPPVPGLAEAGCLSSDTLWGLRTLPRRLLVLGGGPVGCELAQSFARLGSQVTLVEQAPRLLAREDADAAAAVAEALRADGVQLLLGHQALGAGRSGDERWLRLRPPGTSRSDGPEGSDGLDVTGPAEIRVVGDALLCATGRRARVDGLGLEALGIVPNAQGRIDTDARLQTRFPNILAVGDVTSPLQLTHAAAHQAWHAAVNALFGRFWRFRVNERVMPRATFTDPEVARVGLTEAEAQAAGVAYELTHYALDGLDRAITDGRAQGFVKVLTPPGRDRILGVTIVGAQAAEMLAEFTLAMRHGLGLGKILATVHPYPTWSEAARHSAGAWRRAHAPQGLLRWLARYHAWQRGA